MKTIIDYKDLDFAFSITGIWQSPPEDEKDVPQWEKESDNLLKLVANKERFLVCWGEGGSLNSVIGYSPKLIVDIMDKIGSQFGDIQATIYGYGDAWDIDTMDNPEETFFQDILPEIIIDGKIDILTVNGYKITYNQFYEEFQVSHDDIGANLLSTDDLEECIEYSEKG